MKPARIQELVERLVTRDGRYRPLELVRMTGRFDEAGVAEWQAGQVGFLEDILFGHPAVCIEELETAAAWARKLGLRAANEPTRPERRAFRSARAEQLVRTEWQREDSGPQTDLFFDSGQAVARAGLIRSLADADPVAAERELAILARLDPDSSLQADGELLIGGLHELERSSTGLSVLARMVDGELEPAARRIMDDDSRQQYLARFWRHLAELAARSDQCNDALHASVFMARAGDWKAVIGAILAQPEFTASPALLARLTTAALSLQQRPLALEALCQLCWRDREAAETWLEASTDDELCRRIDQFWDLEPAPGTELFPAWLVLAAYPMPDNATMPMPDCLAAQAYSRAWKLRQDPGNLEQRAWFARNHPDLMQQWR